MLWDHCPYTAEALKEAASAIVTHGEEGKARATALISEQAADMLLEEFLLHADKSHRAGVPAPHDPRCEVELLELYRERMASSVDHLHVISTAISLYGIPRREPETA